MAVVSLSSCSSSVPLPPLAESDGSSWDDVLWQDIDSAERYLVSSQFNEAAALSSTILRKLVVIWESSKNGMHNDIDDNEMEGIMEAAGMVLVQAYSESSRKALIFKDLETIFGCTAKGLGRLDLAVLRVKESDIPAERKQEKLDKIASSLGRKEETSLVSYHDKVTSMIPESGEYFSGSQGSESVEIKTDAGAAKQAFKELDSHSSLRSIFVLSPVTDILSRWMTRTSVLYSDRVSKWKTLPTVVYQNKLSFGGAAAVILMIAIYRQRLHLSRWFGGLGKAFQHVLHSIFISLYDFWQLAFNVQLNPLAAVQPLPSTQYGR